MYSFTDTTQAAANSGYPAEAVRINGTYLEDEIDGFKTLYVSGRESLAKQITEYDSTKADGVQVNYTRFPSRTLTVGYQLIAADASGFRLAFNKLNTLLNVENAEIIFRDEQDKYFVGTPINEDDVQAGSNSIVGEYKIYCPDPFKYSTSVTPVSTSPAYDTEDVEEYSTSKTYEIGEMVKYGGKVYECTTAITTAQAWSVANWKVMQGLAFAVNYDGGYKTFPDFEVKFAKDETNGKKGSNANCGFIQFEVAGSRIQFGDYDEEKNTTADRINETFATALGAFSNAASGTTVPGTTFITKASASASSGLKPKYGTYKQNVWHGSYVTAPVTLNNSKFKLEWQQGFIATKKQYGLFGAFLLDASGNAIASARLKKSDAKNTKGVAEYYIGNELKSSKTVDFSSGKAFGKGSDGKLKKSPNIIEYDGEKLSIQLACDEQPEYFYGITPAVKTIAFFFGQYNTKPILSTNVLSFVRFVDGDAGNTFNSEDELYVSCSDASVWLNDKEALSLGDIGNEWSGFYLEPGINIVNVMLSDWITAGYEPTINMYYQKRWI